MQIRAGLNENGAMSKVSYTEKIGSIIYAPTATALPGTLICDGSAVSRSTYADLFAVLGTTAGSGDGSSTFNLPDLRNVWTVGAGTWAVLADVAEALPTITGTLAAITGTSENGGRLYAAWGGTGALVQSLHTGTSFNVCNITTGNSSYRTMAATEHHIDTIKLDAHDSNAIYNRGNHVTLASVALTPCIVYE